MKRIVIVVLLVLVAVGMFAGGPADINGYDWITLSYDEKMMFTLGVLAGIYYANIMLTGYDADGIALARMSHAQSIVELVDIYYGDESRWSVTVVISIVIAWERLRAG